MEVIIYKFIKWFNNFLVTIKDRDIYMYYMIHFCASLSMLKQKQNA